MLSDTETTVPPAAEQCLRLYRRLAAGVAILSARAETGPVGLTASTLTSLSLEPPLLMAGLAVGSYTLTAIEADGAFGVHLLGDHQQRLAEDFASPAGLRFSAHAHHEVQGVPVLDEAAVWSVCTLTDTRRYGDHVLVVGEIAALGLRPTSPLIWHDRRFSTLRTTTTGAAPDHDGRPREPRS